MCLIALLVLAAAITSPAQKLTFFYVFNGSNGAHPTGPLVQGFDGNFYGETYQSSSDVGTAFKLTPERVLTTLHYFCVGSTGCPDGENPDQGLVLSTSGSFYGVTKFGGTNLGGSGVTTGGTVFKISSGGVWSKIHDFCAQAECVDGSNPLGPLVQGTDGSLYGVTNSGGTGGGSGERCDVGQCGTVYRISPTGTFTILHNFCSQSNCLDGVFPTSGLIQAANGSFYGATSDGGTNLGGTIYKISSGGAFTVIHNFCSEANCADGGSVNAPLVQGNDGYLYGTLYGRGAYNGGAVFRISASGTLAILYSFCAVSGCPDGKLPYDGLVLASDGNFYGTTTEGAANGSGTVFTITPSGALTTLVSTGAGSKGQSKALFQATSGVFYISNFSRGDGSILSLSLGLPAFVDTVPTSGKAGAKIVILGTNLTGASSVTFNGRAAMFTVVSATEITANVPTGATTGTVEVTTPSGTLKTNVPFRVR
jgi:uncharacterized repeat protein (TIGR03803 family)